MKILYFFLFLWVIFALLDPDPATQINADPCGSESGYGSGSATLFSCTHRQRLLMTWLVRVGMVAQGYLWDWDGQGCGSALIWVARSGSAFWIFMFWSAGCSFLRAEGFSCSLCVLYGGLGITIAIFIKKYPIFFSCKFFSSFGHQNPGFGTGSGSALYQCGSTTLGTGQVKRVQER